MGFKGFAFRRFVGHQGVGGGSGLEQRQREVQQLGSRFGSPDILGAAM